ncbi:unnamed protein product [Adineta ricciae]|uniref:Uncharacterized protein n=1 Tax=Adineta ricciae TaxID=249248 RepID=A0A815QJW0_ADIRI|nr:unnamed protein product [Adineta ricciae]CAF1464267.1 unnamed protein product [Adineta ricciae]
MLRQIVPIFFNNIKRCYSLSSRRCDKPINSSSSSSHDENFHSIDECEKTIKQIESEGPIDFACLEPIGLDWSSLPDEDFSHLDALDDLESTEGSSNSTKSMKGSEPTVSSANFGQNAGSDEIKHFFSLDEIAAFFIPNLGNKQRPVFILSSSFRNRLHDV